MLCCIDVRVVVHWILKHKHEYTCVRAKWNSCTLFLELVLILLSSNGMCHDVDFRNFNITSIVENTYSHICFVRQCYSISVWSNSPQSFRLARLLSHTSFQFSFNIESIKLPIKWIHYDNIQLTAFNLHWTIEIAWYGSDDQKRGNYVHSSKIIWVVRVENCAHLKHNIGDCFWHNIQRAQQQTLTYWVRLKENAVILFLFLLLSVVRMKFRSFSIYPICTHERIHTYADTQCTEHRHAHIHFYTTV